MVVAADPQLERKEYYKKLYKLISPEGRNPMMDLFAKFTSGNISKEELKTRWAEAALAKEAPVDTPPPKLSRRAELAKRIKEPTQQPDTSNKETNVTDNWEIVDPTNGAVVRRLTGTTFTGASHAADSENQLQGRNSTNQFVVRRASTPQQTPQQTQPAASNQSQAHADNGLPMWEIYQRSNNLPLYRFADHTQGTAWSTAGEWARSRGFHPNDLSMRPATTTEPVGRAAQLAALQPDSSTGSQYQWQAYRISTGNPIGDPFAGPYYGRALTDWRRRVLPGTGQDPSDFDIREVGHGSQPAESLKLTKNILEEFGSWLGELKIPKRLG